jgi:DNA-binding CsgD family transcriptional regulator
MSAAPTVSPLAPPASADHEAVFRLWDDLAAFAAADNDAALNHLLSGLAAMVNAQNAYWMGAVRLGERDTDPVQGWRPCRIQSLQPMPCDEATVGGEERVRAIANIDEYTLAHARLAGTFRAHRLRDVVSPAWFQGPKYQRYSKLGVRDMLVVSVPISDEVECYYGFLAMSPRAPFSEPERDLAAYALRGLTWFHRRTLLAHGLLVASAPLSPVERRVMRLLLTDRPEKLIAAEMKLSPTTLHTYVRGVFRKFGVSGRAGLVSVWLGRG